MKKTLIAFSALLAMGVTGKSFYDEMSSRDSNYAGRTAEKWIDLKTLNKKVPENIPVYDFSTNLHGTHNVLKYSMSDKPSGLTGRDGKWTLVYIGMIRNMFGSASESKRIRKFQSDQGRFLNQMYKFIDSKTTDLVFVNAAAPDGNPFGIGEFSKSCGKKCYDFYRQGGVSRKINGSTYLTTQEWMTDVVYGVPYSRNNAVGFITDLPIVLVIDDKKILREVMPLSFTAKNAAEINERLAELQANGKEPFYTKGYKKFLASGGVSAFPSFTAWLSGK